MYYEASGDDPDPRFKAFAGSFFCRGESVTGVLRCVECVNLKQNSCQSEVCGPGFFLFEQCIFKIAKKKQKQDLLFCNFKL